MAELDEVAVGIGNDAEVTDDLAAVDGGFFENSFCRRARRNLINLFAAVYRVAEVGERGRLNGIGVVGADQYDHEFALASFLAQPHHRHLVFGTSVNLDQADIVTIERDCAFYVSCEDSDVCKRRVHVVQFTTAQAGVESSEIPKTGIAIK